jgi:hypothetical protein
MTGAVDLSECPRRVWWQITCRCLPKCRICGFGKHMAVHGPAFGQPPGSKPYDHEFEAEVA